MRTFKVVAITHKKAGLDLVGKFHIQEDKRADELHALKAKVQWKELMYLSTCNRVEFYISSSDVLRLEELLEFFDVRGVSLAKFEVYEGRDAIKHLFKVAGSIESMVVGEREIITQVRNAYDHSRACGLSGDNLRLAIRKTIETAKRIYTETAISNNPVSIVSLAYRELKKHSLPKNARILVIGAGQTNTAMCRFLSKNGWSDITIFNRTLSRAQLLAEQLKLKARPLKELKDYKKGFDVLLTCTGSDSAIITSELYQKISNSETDKKIVIDLAVPEDVDRQVLAAHIIDYISVASLKPIANKNLEKRKAELKKCKTIIDESLLEFDELFKERKVERAMSEVPDKIKEIKNFAVSSLFKEDLENLDDDSREVLNKVLSYVEKKYISVPMKLAKEIILDKRYETGK